ncbi:hypothetical protein BLOT_007803 [Blomia tropicalis]|nr:hypothetical protein BLOT_007803 [Blomia tropicalis]
MKPHQFFNRYFACRFTLKSSIDDVTIDNSHLLLNENNFIDQRNGTLNNRTFTTTTTTAPVSSVSQPLYRHSKRQSRRNKKLKLQCPIDCDGVTRWPETAANSVHYISCMDVRRSVQQIPSTVINYNDVELGMMTQDETISSSSISSIDQTNSEDWTKLDSGERITPIENYMYNEKKLALANASRRCTIDGKWEIQADYTKCGFESAQLFVLIPEPFCERTFDGWTCFNDTPATHVVYFRCPSFVYGFNPQNDAHKTCNNNGKWKVHNETLVPWTNYTSCVDMPDLQFRNLIIKIHIFAYGISLLALLISIAIFFSFKTLSSQTRIRIHKNFFVSFIMNNFMWIIWYFAITDQNILFENGLYCQAVHILLHYFLLCNYFWMFCEGLYLHTILVVAFVSEEKILKWFYLIGWGTPVLIASAYAFFRGNSLDTLNCWVDDSIYSWILKVPVLLSFVVGHVADYVSMRSSNHDSQILQLNIIFLVNIIRVLVTKLQAVNSADTHQTRKAVRATLILIPLLGLHFILTPFRPEDRSQFAQIYEIFSALVSSLQGCCVAMLFCFFNGEVLAQIRKRWTQFLLVHGYGSSNHRMSYGGTTVSVIEITMSITNANLNFV